MLEHDLKNTLVFNTKWDTKKKEDKLSTYGTFQYFLLLPFPPVRLFATYIYTYKMYIQKFKIHLFHKLQYFGIIFRRFFVLGTNKILWSVTNRLLHNYSDRKTPNTNNFLF